MKKYIILSVLSFIAFQGQNIKAQEVAETVIGTVEEASPPPLPPRDIDTTVQTDTATSEELTKELKKALKLTKTQKLALKVFKKAFDKIVKYLGSGKGRKLRKQITAFILNKLTLASEGYVVLPKQEHIDLLKQIHQFIKDEGLVEKGKGQGKELLIKLLQQLQKESEVAGDDETAAAIAAA